ncbi:MAG: RpiB/LacA/LacB family sugar-phosphate isomerase [Oscillospiraceae bacterium]|nr:RpiB/LacA/LacB family sugar-phosphate isomerase [Oscillospiraceae bacterium]
MKVVISCEFAGFPLKSAVLEYLKSKGHDILDVGQKSPDEKILYPQAAAALAKVIQGGEYKKGVLICGTGAGVSIVANKFKGVYAVACESIFTARGIPVINDANVLVMGNNVVGQKNACAMVEQFLSASFADGETPERKVFLSGMLDDVKRIEDENFK